ncbi:uncharacterized protein [Pyxicephalus adspersus]|uniref:uncharacterized protein n=1 Tax=Pyxicephalus adspersus TaxID=30357 RepID=UPI003B59DDD4
MAKDHLWGLKKEDGCTLQWNGDRGVVMDEINLIQSWSRYNNKVQALQKTLGLSALQKTELMTFHKTGSKEEDDSSRKTFVSGSHYITGRQMHKEILKPHGHSAVHLLRESYFEGMLKKSPSASPKQEVIDKVLIRRSLAHADRLKNLEEAIRELEATKGHLKKELKNLKARNEFFGNGKHLQATEPNIPSFPYDPRKETKNTNPLGTDFLKGLEMDDHFMDDIIREVMSANLSYQPQKRDPATTAMIQKLNMESSRDHAIHLIEEEIILEVTSEMSKHITLDVYRRMALSTEFDSCFDSTEVQEYLKSTNPLDF